MPALLSGSLLLKGQHPGLPGWPCPLRALTGVPCPACFLTRATGAALAGDLERSLQLHAFGPPLAAGLLLWTLMALRQRRLRPRPPIRPPTRGRLSGLALGAGLLGYWGWRLLVHGFPDGTPPLLR